MKSVLHRAWPALILAAFTACGGGAHPARRLPAGGGLVPLTPSAQVLFEAPRGGRIRLRLDVAGDGLLRYEAAAVPTQDTGADGLLLAAGERRCSPGGSTVEFDLPPSPEPVRLRLDWRGDGSAAEATAGLELLEAQGERPSIVFISLDTLSARHLSLHGYDRDTSPRLIELAEEALVFERAWSNAPWTTPSYASQFTGLMPSASRPAGTEREADTEREQEAPDWFVAHSRWTLPEALQGLGLRTAAFVDNPNIPGQLGFAQGFEVYDESATERELDDPDGGFLHLAPLALDWLAGLSEGESFFLFLQAIDVHTPYVPRDSVRGRYRDDGRRASRVLPVADEGGCIFGAIPRYAADLSVGGHHATLDAVLLEAAYDEEIRALDQAVGDFLDELRARGVLDRAWLIISADHGESTGAHDSWFQHVLGYGEELHVPLIVRPPGGTRGRRVPDRVQLLDLYPTLLDLAGANPLRDGFQGRSLRPLLEGGRLDPVPILGEVTLLDGGTVVQDEWKLVRTRLAPAVNGLIPFLSHPRTRAWLARLDPTLAGRVIGTREFPLSSIDPVRVAAIARRLPAELLETHFELYDLRADRDELRDLAAEHPERVARLREILDEALAHANAYRASPGSVAAPLDAATREQLEKLGYAGR